MWILALVALCVALLFGGMWWIPAVGFMGYATYATLQKQNNWRKLGFK